MIKFILFSFALSSAMAVGVENGDYSSEGAWGSLKVTQASATGFHFELSSYNALAHTCDARGEAKINGGKAEYLAPASDHSEKCQLTFTLPSSEKMEISADCSGSCGANMTMDGAYVRIPSNCVDKAIKERKAQFQALHRKKSYPEAEAMLLPAITQCGFFLGPMDKAWIYSDLALVAHKEGDDKKCHENLDRLQKTGVLDFEDAPIFKGQTAKLKKALMTNRNLCGKR